MKTHDEIRKLLPDYAGGELDPEQRALVEQHLRSCAICRDDLADLELTLRLVRSTPRVEPPPWLAARIMARLEQEAPGGRSWLRLLFYPLRVKLPLELTALATVCLVSYYLTRTMGPGLPEKLPDQRVASAPVTPAAPAQVPPPEKVDPSAVQPPTPSPAERPMPSPAGRPTEYPSPPTVESTAPSAEETSPVAPAFVPSESRAARSLGTRDEAPPLRAREEATEFEAAPAMKSAGQQNGMERAASRAVPSTRLVIRLVPNSPLPADAVRRVLTDCGGSLISDGISPEGRRVRGRIPAPRLPQLIKRLKLLGNLTEQPVTGEDAVIEVEIAW